MSLILSGTDGLSDVDGSAATPAIRGTDANTGIFFPAADTIAFAEGGVEAMRIDSSGNVGIGVTPFANTLGKSLDLVNGAGVFGNSNNAYWTANSYYDSAWKYKATASAVFLGMESGSFRFNIASSGTAGNAITFTEALRLNTNGALVLQGGSTSATGVGIAFPATQSASSDANTLDDYEEGTFTPSLGGNTTYSIQQGSYTKVGRMVYLNFDISVTTLGTGSATTFSGMPFASGTGTSNAGVVSYFTNIGTSSYSLFIRNDAGTSLLNIYPQNSQSTGIGAGSVFGNASRVIGSMTYQV